MRPAPGIALAALLAAACGEPSDSASPYIRLDPYASVVSPPSQRDEVVLLEGGTACVIETYWYRVVCTDPESDSFTFGTEGEGPGEFTDPSDILRGPAGTIGVVDRRLNRVSMFSPPGQFIASTPGLPDLLSYSDPSAVRGTMTARYRKFDPGAGSSSVQGEIDAATGRVIWERTVPEEADVVDCSTSRAGRDRPPLGAGYSDGSGGLLFVTCLGEFLIWYADRDAEDPTAIVRSTYVERYPSDEDVAALMGWLNSLPAGGFRPFSSEEEIRERPKVWYGARVVDDGRRFWAVSHWNSVDDVIPALSYIDMFRLTEQGPRHALTLQVADKVVAMDVLGNTLAVLVQRDVGGVIPERRVNWFDVTQVTAQR
ncbi:MAG: hypothetical protein OXI39_10210 [Gemmatimonadota bacterium]|uniref:hypothetical protein n=1 Tax=Candidatus Palauibacter scopulicola TaxID=3056741 RepID=UPI002383A139|nr:hypothetical protein [Candidatus Palauibacter scopulicola]MDE2663359.1 hypothetical protein [Candidatus Palauibacter scopulicola]